MTPAFYKGKLQEMVKLATGAVGKFLEHLSKICGPTGQNQIDIIDEISRLSVSVLLTCVLGKDIGDNEMEFRENGTIKRVPISFVLRDTF